MQIEFWSFSKRSNSTKRPSISGTVKNFVYKDASDYHNPTIELSAWDNSWNYAKIENIYFYVNRCAIIANNLFNVSLSIDLLATFREEILNSKAFVLRASSGYNKFLVDECNLPTTELTRTVLQANGAQGFYETGDGCYVVEVINAMNGEIATGFNAAAILTSTQMAQLASKLLTDQDLITDLSKSFNKPIEAIVNVHWLPLNYGMVCAATMASSGKFYIGAFNTDITVHFVNISFIEFTDEFDLTNYIPNDYTRNGKFLDMQLCLPYVGTVGFDIKQLAETDDKKIRIHTCVDVRTGKQLSIIRKSLSQNAPINTYETIIATPFTLSSATTNQSSALYNIATVVPNTLAASMISPMAGIATATASFTSSLLTSATPIYSTVGTSGGTTMLGYGIANRCVIIERGSSYNALDDDVRQLIGLPVHKVVLLSTLGIGSYVQILKASMNIIAYKDEIEKINELLNGGVYIE